VRCPTPSKSVAPHWPPKNGNAINAPGSLCTAPGIWAALPGSAICTVQCCTRPCHATPQTNLRLLLQLLMLSLLQVHLIAESHRSTVISTLSGSRRSSRPKPVRTNATVLSRKRHCSSQAWRSRPPMLQRLRRCVAAAAACAPQWPSIDIT